MFFSLKVLRWKIQFIPNRPQLVPHPKRRINRQETHRKADGQSSSLKPKQGRRFETSHRQCVYCSTCSREWLSSFALLTFGTLRVLVRWSEGRLRFMIQLTRYWQFYRHKDRFLEINHIQFVDTFADFFNLLWSTIWGLSGGLSEWFIVYTSPLGSTL